MARVRLEGIEKRYGRDPRTVVALDAVSLDVADGELLAVLGPSGCGKTTLLRVVAGLTAPESGRVFFDGHDVTRVPAEARRTGFVFQRAALYPHLSVFDNVAYGPRSRGKPPREVAATVEAVVRRVRLDASLLTRKPGELSGGQQQRVALARALAGDPQILLLDEPLAGLDAPLRAELRLELLLLREAGTGALFVTHDQSEALGLGHRVAVMNAGRIEQIAAPREIYERPCNRFVAGFIGSPPMSFLTGFYPATIAGFRAEDVRLDPHGTLRGTVRAVEDAGARAYVFVAGAFGSIVAEARDRALPRAGENVALSLDEARAHRFDPRSGRRVETPSSLAGSV